MIRHIRNEKGVALMIVLLIATITLAVTTTMLYMLTQSTRLSGYQKRYATAREAALASTNVITEMVRSKGDNITVAKLANAVAFARSPSMTTLCEESKFNRATLAWSSECFHWNMVMDYNDNTTYDNTFVLGNYTIYSKIVWTIPGNTGRSSGVQGQDIPERFINTCVVHCEGQAGGGGGATAGGLPAPVIPATYVIEVDARNNINPKEAAKLSLLLRY